MPGILLNVPHTLGKWCETFPATPVRPHETAKWILMYASASWRPCGWFSGARNSGTWWWSPSFNQHREFERVAPRYDLMNDLMSVGLHRLWKRYLVGNSRFVWLLLRERVARRK